MVNVSVVQGRLTRDPELKTLPSGHTVVEMTVANDVGKAKTNFVPVTCWDRTAEFASKWLSKGREVIVRGQLCVDNYTDREGHRRTKVYIRAESIDFTGSRPAAADKPAEEPAQEPDPFAPMEYEPLSEDDGTLPF